VHAAALSVELHLPEVRSLKQKRGVIKPIVEGSRHRFGVAAAEVGKQDRWQACELAFAVVASTAYHVEEVLDSVERFVWSFADVEVLSCERYWWGQ
jgi:uncharacterized protein YlxP (DUF503 family)